MAKFPQVEWVEIDGRMVPSTKPQHYKKGSTTDTELTGHDNPLPTADYGMTEGGLWIPKRVSDEGAQHTRVTGSIVEDGIKTSKVIKQELETLLDAVSINSGERSSNVNIDSKDADDIYFFISVDKQPWRFDYRNQFGNVNPENGYPEYSNEEKTYPAHAPAISMPLGYRASMQNLAYPSNLKEAKDWKIPTTPSEYFRFTNNSSETATVTVNILRVWR